MKVLDCKGRRTETTTSTKRKRAVMEKGIYDHDKVSKRRNDNKALFHYPSLINAGAAATRK
jgi:hypothetical protein